MRVAVLIDFLLLARKISRELDAIGTVLSSTVLVHAMLCRRGIAAAWPGALVRPLPGVLAAVSGQDGGPSRRDASCRRGIATARPGARVEPKACPIILALRLLPLRVPLHPADQEAPRWLLALEDSVSHVHQLLSLIHI